MAKRNRNKDRMKKEVLSIARACGDLEGLYWFVTMDVTGAASDSNQRFPVVPVDQFGESEIWADLLVGFFAYYNPDHKFDKDLTHVEALEELNLDWYEWGEEAPAHQCVDEVCQWCGGVNGCDCGLPHPGERHGPNWWGGP